MKSVMNLEWMRVVKPEREVIYSREVQREVWVIVSKIYDGKRSGTKQNKS